MALGAAVQALLDAKADASLQAEDGYTALMYAEHEKQTRKHTATAQLLRQHAERQTAEAEAGATVLALNLALTPCVACRTQCLTGLTRECMMETTKIHSRTYTHIPFTSVRQTASAEPRVISGQISGQGQPRTVLCMLSADAASLSEERRRLAVGIVLADKLFPDVLAVHCRPPLGDGAISNSSLHGGE